MKPLISFIITYHNEPEAYLQACLESIKALPLAEDEVEIIVVDDGKTFKGQRSKVNGQLIRQEQAGLSVARNTGIDNAQGLYIQFVDADDLLIPVAYKAVIEQLRKREADVLLFKMSKKQKESCGGQMLHRCSGAEYLMNHNLRAAACGYAFKREILGDLRFHPGILHEDELFTPQLFLRAETLVELDAKAYFYRQHSGTITHSDSSKKVQMRLDDIRFVIRMLSSLDEPLLERRICQLTTDYLQKIFILTHSFLELRRRVKELRREPRNNGRNGSQSLLPLPLRCYSLRYLLIAFMTKFS